ncbi:MAG TPA: polysaccharide deacetylase family protein [Candidatus Saccharimonadia bacterium]|nr:polysaccharide deacetylase family protein [Candidatus Saccharimonadia bacterium]
MGFSLRGLSLGRAKKMICFSLVGLALLGSGAMVALTLPAPDAVAGPSQAPHALRVSLGAATRAVKDFEARQTKAHLELVSPKTLSSTLASIQLDLAQGRFTAAQQSIASLRASLTQWNNRLTDAANEAVKGPIPNSSASAVAGELFIPIVLYHYTPPNFEQQLEYLEQHGYTTIGLDQVAAALAGNNLLPAKPVVLTFDDGFANQMQAFTLLQQHHMRATYYIINGGAKSNWCIGAGRRYNDPVQPPGGCGDAYLSWDQVRTLDRSGLITIGGHTLDHPNLASLSADDQRHEIIDSKTQLEQELGHPIRDFAYPYGNYNATTIQIVQEAGYATAVTTAPGQYQLPGQPYTLRRLRDTLSLP